MLVLLGNAVPHQIVTDDTGNRSFKRVEGGPRVTKIVIPDDAYPLTVGADVGDIQRHLLTHRDVTQLPGLEAFLAIAHPDQGHWPNHSPQPPTWVWSDNPEMSRLLSEHFGCPIGAPADVNETHVTHSGGVPAEAMAS